MSERETLQLIDERDNAEEAISQAYYIVTGHSPEWSNKFGYQEALEDIGDVVAVLKAATETPKEVMPVEPENRAVNAPPQPAPSPAGAMDLDNLLQFRKRLSIAGEFLCGLTDDPKAREAYAAVLYVQSSLLLDAEEMRLAAKEQPAPDRETIQILLDLLNPLHGSLDEQTCDDKHRENFDAPRDSEYNVNITAQMERDLTQAVCILEDRLRSAPQVTEELVERIAQVLEPLENLDITWTEQCQILARAALTALAPGGK